MVTTKLYSIYLRSPIHIYSWNTLLTHLGKNAWDTYTVGYDVILQLTNLDFALWCTRAKANEAVRWATLVLRFAQRIEHLLPKSIQALEIAADWVNNMATEQEVKIAALSALDVWSCTGDPAKLAAYLSVSSVAKWAYGRPFQDHKRYLSDNSITWKSSEAASDTMIAAAQYAREAINGRLDVAERQIQEQLFLNILNED